VNDMISVSSITSDLYVVQLKSQFVTVNRLASSSGAGSSYDPQTGVNVTTTSEQTVINDFAAKNSAFIHFYVTLLI